jgi:hypothetical protein
MVMTAFTCPWSNGTPERTGVTMTQHNGSTSLGLIDALDDTVTVAGSPVVGSNSMAIRFNAAGIVGYVTGYRGGFVSAFEVATGQAAYFKA